MTARRAEAFNANPKRRHVRVVHEVYMCCTCTAPVLYVRCACTVRALYMRCVCALCACYMCTVLLCAVCACICAAYARMSAAYALKLHALYTCVMCVPMFF